MDGHGHAGVRGAFRPGPRAWRQASCPSSQRSRPRRPTFLLGLAFLHPVRHLPQGVEEEVSLLLADDLGGGGRQGVHCSGKGLPGGVSWGHGHGGLCELTPVALIALQMHGEGEGTDQHSGAASPAHIPPPPRPRGSCQQYLVCNLDEETAAFPGGQLQPGGHARTHIPHPGVGAHLQHLGQRWPLSTGPAPRARPAAPP